LRTGNWYNIQMYDPQVVSQDFPIFSLPHPSGKPLVYLDSAATSQKPEVVIDAISEYYRTNNANVHRGIHYLGDKSTRAWHGSRDTIAQFFGADPEELVMVRNTTEALNVVAYSLEEKISEGDIILATQMEHHSNLVPWQELARRTSATLELIPVTKEGTLDLEWLRQKVKDEKIKVLALAHVSNTLGTINPISEIKNLFKKPPIIVVDGAQAAPHMKVDFHQLGVDFYAVSAHKMLGPMGTGGLFVRKQILKNMKPWLFGGGMIDEVEDTKATWAEDTQDKFTAGTPDVAGAVGWAAACKYLSTLHMDQVFAHDQELVTYTLEQLAGIPEITIAGPKRDRSGSVSFIYKGIHSHDVAQILDSEGVAVRSGHHCTMPLHHHMEWVATTRVSFNVYTTKRDIDVLVMALQKVKDIFRK
jgi:cysteine desulfurase / selenocysteine lyase